MAILLGIDVRVLFLSMEIPQVACIIDLTAGVCVEKDQLHGMMKTYEL